MGFALSPSIIVTESDLTTTVPAVATTDAAIAGVFHWGPVDQRELIDSQMNLKERFGPPSNFNYETWWTAANFLDYGTREYVVRVANTSANTPSETFSVNTSVANVLHMTDANATYTPVSLGIETNMRVFWASNTGAVPLDAVVTAVNSTAVSISTNATVNSSSDVGFYSNVSSYNALAIAPGGQVDNVGAQVVKNRDHYETKDNAFDLDLYYLAKYPGAIGNSLRISVCDSADAYYASLSLSNTIVEGAFSVDIGSDVGTFTFTAPTNGAAANTLATTIIASIANNDYLEVGNSSIGRQYLKVLSTDNTPTLNTSTNVATFNVEFEDPYRLSYDWSANDSIVRYWEFYGLTELAPGQSNFVAERGNTAANDELHVVVVDNDGAFSGTPGTVLEVYRGLSRATDATADNGSSIYYKEVLNKSSKYVWLANDRSNAPSANAWLVASSTNTEALDLDFTLGTDGKPESTVSVGLVMQGYDRFASAEDVDISLVLQGKPRGGVDPSTGSVEFQLFNYLIDNIGEIRKDCVVFGSPEINTCLNNYNEEALSIVDWRNSTRSSSYAVMDSGYKQQYDKYNDVYRWIPLNADMAGLCARTDQTNDPWWSPAGLNRGHIKNLVTLAWNPRMAHRDILYKNGVNPVVRFNNEGTVLWGDKTLLAKPSAFDRINVRRLFIVLEKAISTASKYFLFEFNDRFTREQFKNMVNPYLKFVQSRRGIQDFLVVCDETNNTPYIIDSNSFVADIYIKPNRSINWIYLNFVAVATGISFEEIVGGSRIS